MSLLTSFLNLFKYEETDEGNFDIQLALNNNWDKIDASMDSHQNDQIIHRKITSGTADPSGGNDGDIYLQYE